MTEHADSFDPKEYIPSLPRRPGVYRMYGPPKSGAGDDEGRSELLYVGKARNLRDRVGNYFMASNVDPKVQALVGHIARIEVTLTNSETEALLLEYNLIKEHKPRYNIVLRDDKSFPYVYLPAGHEYPRLVFYRGPRNLPGRYFGPFPSAGAVKETLQSIQKIFRIRNCRDTFFENRSRPCLQHQIGRCSAPCVKLISREDYARDIAAAVKVLEGRNDEVSGELTNAMEKAAESLQYERAAALRDQLAALKQVQAQQIVTAEGDRDIDVFALVGEPGEFAISVMIIRGGRNLGSTCYFPKGSLAEPNEALASFLMQYYAETPAPPEILVNLELAEAEALTAALNDRSGITSRLWKPSRALPARWLAMTVENATQALRMRRARRADIEEMMVALGELLGLEEAPKRLECFDISHTAGEGTVASCVIYGPEGPIKKDYRRFNITGVTPGDDYGALRQALKRRYERVRSGEAQAPDVLLIDGGLGQINEVHVELAQLGFGDLKLVGVAKGPDRKPGQERLFVFGSDVPLVPGPDSRALRVIQRIRDEAHRFAITGHRKRRARRHNESVLETIPGLGPAKRRALLRHFGGMQGLMRAGVGDLESVAGIGTTLARTLYDHLHPGA
ncbi:MAG TPA: excinuclease ABC subunit UvrC [Steroidobacteraceae bacterium]|nr:excinuclease ABC subunit UvrC [Steroidobacteraceae bacterium]